MNVKTVKRTEPRIETPSLTNLGIQAYGHNNLYPQEIMQLVASSESASTCLDRYISFIQGNGFKDINFSQQVINTAGETNDDMVQLLATDMANFKGIALLVNYNVLGEIVELYHVPFENCRLTEPNEEGNITKIALHTDWTGKTKRNGKTLRVCRENIDYINVFNPNKETVLQEIEDCGGIENYKGQILWISEAGINTYPKPVHDSVASHMSTEEGLGNIANRNTRNNFQPAGAFVTRKGQNTKGENAEVDFLFSEEESIPGALAKMQGDTNCNKIVHFEIEYDEEMPEFKNIQGTNYDKEYTVTTETAERKIYSAFNQEIWYRIKIGSIGFSSEILKDAFTYYSTVTNKERRIIERAFEKIFQHWHQEINTTNDYSIQPLQYTNSSTNTESLITMYEKNMITLNEVLNNLGFIEKKDGNNYATDINSIPLAVRLGNEGTQNLQAILSDVSMNAESKVAALEVLFSISTTDAKKLIYG